MKKSMPCLLMLALLIIIPAYSQSLPVNDSLKIIEKVYLHVDRDTYYPGDNIWLKAYLVEATDRLLSNHSMNLHVELISPDSKIIASRIIKLTNGLGNGDFQLSGKLSSGRYTLRAYTNYMRNFSEELFFNKDITIINSSDANKLISDTISYVKNKVDLSFYPEGGSLVDSVASIVAFKAVNVIGEGYDVSGEVFTSKGEIITAFRSSHKGMGIFSFTPTAGVSYYARIKSATGEVEKFGIPASFSTGITLSVSKKKENGLRVTIKTNKESMPLLMEHELSLNVSARNMIYKTIRFKIKSLNNFYTIPINDLPDGIIMLTVSGMEGLPLCERLVYIQNSKDLKLNLETDKKEYKQRDSVSMKLSFPKDSGKIQGALLSVSVGEKKFTGDSVHFPSTISSWFLLESDVHGPVEEPSYYFDSSNPKRSDDLDLLLCTQGWRDFKWKYDKMKYEPEYGFTISGRVRKLFADVPLKHAKVNIVIAKKESSSIVTMPTNSSGRFSLSGVDFIGDAQLIASAIGKKEELQGWLLLDSVRYSPSSINEKVFQKTNLLAENQTKSFNPLSKEKLNVFIKDDEAKKAIKKKYKLSDTIEIPGIEIIGQRRQDEFVRNSRQYYLTPDEELVITPELEHQIEIYNNVRGLIRAQYIPKAGGMHNPIYMINGAKVDPSELYSIPFDIIDRIDVLWMPASIAVFGAQGADLETVKGRDTNTHLPDGVINIITRVDGSSKTTADYHSIHLKISGYNEARIFYSPKHATDLKSDYKPDLRTTLYWEPNIKMLTNQDFMLKYFNADNSSTIRVIAEGITTSGIPITAKIEYEVK
jgi:hypothetical protein